MNYKNKNLMSFQKMLKQKKKAAARNRELFEAAQRKKLKIIR